MGDDGHRHYADYLVNSRVYLEERLRMHRKWFVNYCSIGVYVYLCIDNYKSMEKVKEFLKKLWSLVRVDGLEHIVGCILLTFALGWIRPMWITALVVILVGLGKEFYDYFSKKDYMPIGAMLRDVAHNLICDCVGITVGFLFIIFNLLAR